MNEAMEQRARRLFAALVGRRSGIMSELRLAPTIDGDAPLFHAGARIANTHPGLNGYTGLSVGGSGSTMAEAVVATLAEGVERYAASCYHTPSMPLSERRKLDGPSLDPAELACFSAEQRAQAGFPFIAPTDDTPLRWVRGRDLRSGSECWTPAFAVYVPYIPAPPEPLIAPSLSTGLACAESLEAAIARGTLEVIERDAAALTWLKGITPLRIPPEVLMQAAGDLLPPRDSAAAYDLTSDQGVPVRLVLCRGMGPRGRIVSIGTAADADPAAALRKAAREASQGRIYVRMLIDEDPNWRAADDFSNITDFPLHARAYSRNVALEREGLALLDRADVCSGDMAGPAMPQRRQTGVWVDLTPPWAAAVGLHVARVIVPGLLPLHGHYHLAYLGHPRLACWREAMPYGAIRHSHRIWPYPHPFP